MTAGGGKHGNRTKSESISLIFLDIAAAFSRGILAMIGSKSLHQVGVEQET